MNIQSGVVTSSTGTWYRVRLDNGSDVAARLKGKFRLQGRELTNPIAVGDQVDVQVEENDGSVITHIHDRRNYLIRTAAKQSSRYHLVASNIDLAVIVITLAHPRTSNGFVDRFLTTCEAYGIAALLVFNKTDLLSEAEVEDQAARMEVYQRIGYPVLSTSFTATGVPTELREMLKGKRTLLFGHSGVGKSTLINCVIPNAGQQVAEISKAVGKGQHTTTNARMLFFDEDSSALIDTPGIKEFGLETVEEWRLAHYFPEMRQVLANCRFNNCLHNSEPGCAVIEAVEKGEIALFRYESYLNILFSIHEDLPRR
ncbi:MAG: ribosome small subunit-dependent GTPase A [Bacteroidetes bacterium]|nr:ribosome small subunit-dependent GTPase A [Bacteroidota bacterium]